MFCVTQKTGFSKARAYPTSKTVPGLPPLRIAKTASRCQIATKSLPNDNFGNAGSDVVDRTEHTHPKVPKLGSRIVDEHTLSGFAKRRGEVNSSPCSARFLATRYRPGIRWSHRKSPCLDVIRRR